MPSSSTLDPENFPGKSRTGRKDNGSPALGPSDSSDSGSDLAGTAPVNDDELTPVEGAGARTDGSDRYGTGERRSVGDDAPASMGKDIDVDRVVGPEEAGLGDGLDQAEEAQLGITDEELERHARDHAPLAGKRMR